MRCKTFSFDFWIYLIGFLVIIGVICCLPVFFVHFHILDFFKETGQIGDTIGGIMGPLVAIAAAMLTFLAFWVQFNSRLTPFNEVMFRLKDLKIICLITFSY